MYVNVNDKNDFDIRCKMNYSYPLVDKNSEFAFKCSGALNMLRPG